MSLSRLWGRLGKGIEARGLVAAVYDWFTEGFETADLQEARTCWPDWREQGGERCRPAAGCAAKLRRARRAMFCLDTSHGIR